MDSLFDEQPAQAIIMRIETLAVDSPRGWGKMSVEEMLSHCSLSLGMALGSVTLPRSLMGRVGGRLALWLAVRDEKPFWKNTPTDPGLLKPAVTGSVASVESAKGKLSAEVGEFQALGAQGMPTDPHPFFGKVTPAQWDRLTMKHLDHHLRQFGV